MRDPRLVVSPGSPNVETVPAMLPNLETAERGEKCIWCGRTRYASERVPTQVRQVAPQWGFFGGRGFGSGGWSGSATQYGGGFWGR
jgi:hypothetical protein